jgi:carbon-monoxide dehydrogenase large subunit
MHANAASATGIGARIPRRELKRLLSGHGRYVDDIKLPGMLHACFVRSPHPHAKVVSIEVAAAKEAPGVAAVFTAADINPKCGPLVGVALHRPGHRSAPQHLLAAERAVWQGQPVAIVVAESRAEAEDAAELVAIEWQPLPAVGDQLQAIAPGAPVMPSLATTSPSIFLWRRASRTRPSRTPPSSSRRRCALNDRWR